MSTEKDVEVYTVCLVYDNAIAAIAEAAVIEMRESNHDECHARSGARMKTQTEEVHANQRSDSQSQRTATTTLRQSVMISGSAKRAKFNGGETSGLERWMRLKRTTPEKPI